MCILLIMINNITNSQYSIPTINALKPLVEETSSISANAMPITKKAIQEPNVLKKTNNNVYPDFIRKVYNNEQSSSHGSLTESFIRSRASLSPAYMQNEVATRYNMISSIPVILPQIKKVNITA